jgi:hypothetical protein
VGKPLGRALPEEGGQVPGAGGAVKPRQLCVQGPGRLPLGCQCSDQGVPLGECLGRGDGRPQHAPEGHAARERDRAVDAYADGVHVEVAPGVVVDQRLDAVVEDGGVAGHPKGPGRSVIPRHAPSFYRPALFPALQVAPSREPPEGPPPWPDRGVRATRTR